MEVVSGVGANKQWSTLDVLTARWKSAPEEQDLHYAVKGLANPQGPPMELVGTDQTGQTEVSGQGLDG